MTYSPIIPQGPPSPKDQVSSVQINFAQFAAIFSSTVLGVKYNHTALNDFNQGDHESIILTNQSVDPSVDQDFDVLYCRNAVSKAGTQPQIFLRIPPFLPTQLDPTTPNPRNPPIQLTYNSVNTSAPVYQTFLPGGYLLYFGNTNTTGTITLTPSPTQIVSIIAQANTMTTVGTPIPVAVSANITGVNTFSINSSLGAPSVNFSWMVLAQQ